MSSETVVSQSMLVMVGVSADGYRHAKDAKNGKIIDFTIFDSGCKFAAH